LPPASAATARLAGIPEAAEADALCVLEMSMLRYLVLQDGTG
jgi:hypothetical protein